MISPFYIKQTLLKSERERAVEWKNKYLEAKKSSGEKQEGPTEAATEVKESMNHMKGTLKVMSLRSKKVHNYVQ